LEPPEPALEPEDQLFSLVGQVYCRPYIVDVAPDSPKVPRGKGQDSRNRLDRISQPVHLAIRYCTNLAQPLGDDEIGPELPDLSGVECDYRAASLSEPAHFRIDCSARGPWVNRRAGDPGKSLD
jgi:hypothetical protein